MLVGVTTSISPTELYLVPGAWCQDICNVVEGRLDMIVACCNVIVYGGMQLVPGYETVSTGSTTAVCAAR